jgi:peptidoglycan/xylan/chitin deacetylase (PgdA/CDA1 family)
MIAVLALITPLLLGCVLPKNAPMNTTGIPVLMYHEVVTTEEKMTYFSTNQLIMTVERFEQHMQYLHDNGYRTLTMDEFYCYMTDQCDVPEKSVLITIDDGNQATYRYILPILKHFHLNATSFIITSRMPKTSLPWNPASRVFMGKDQIQQAMSEYPHLEFHSHSHDQHGFLDDARTPPLMDYAAILKDVQLSRVLLETDVYAYPFGYVTDTIVQALQNAGYKMAFVTDEAIRAQPNTDLFRIPRYAVKSSTNLHKFKEILGEE